MTACFAVDSIPLVVLTGQVPTHLIGTDAFQECDTVGITRPCTKNNWLVKDVNDLSRVLHEAFEIATTGRPGPVVIDIPKNVQVATAMWSEAKPQRPQRYNPRVKADDSEIARAIGAGDRVYWDAIGAYVDALHAHQQQPPAGRPGG